MKIAREASIDEIVQTAEMMVGCVCTFIAVRPEEARSEMVIFRHSLVESAEWTHDGNSFNINSEHGPCYTIPLIDKYYIWDDFIIIQYSGMIEIVAPGKLAINWASAEAIMRLTGREWFAYGFAVHEAIEEERSRHDKQRE